MIEPTECDTYSTVVPPRIMLSIFSSLFCWKARSPTDRISSTIRISGSTIVAMENARRATMPDEKLRTGTSMKSCSSENATISSYLLSMKALE